MSVKRATRPAFIVALAALFVLLAGAPAAATIATPAGWPPDVVDCVDAPGPSSSSSSPAQACFRAYGDQIWVYDRDTPYAAIGEWQNQLYYGGTWHNYRSGDCQNLEGEGAWGVCNYDFYEDGTTHRYRDQGSRVRFRACGAWGCSGWSPWWRNNN
ncbi:MULTISPECIES: hypothetical protein [Micromonospora]|uniref:hypothetical protein n=1 Tax=Micromonospora TaxID=1873 RepID=UPI001EE7B242|nr:hypothetical protein [Micromonospora hortensis]MCG5452164.1 hypothetical protein [Micromonospora hortensis]WTI10137.1 hypothetical protein OHB44_10890 [Micromonospora sp. NBC_00821]